MCMSYINIDKIALNKIVFSPFLKTEKEAGFIFLLKMVTHNLFVIVE